MTFQIRRSFFIGSLAILASCTDDSSSDSEDTGTELADIQDDSQTDATDETSDVAPETEEPWVEPAPPDFSGIEFTPAQAPMRRLTRSQYANAIADVFGPEIVVPLTIEPDIRESGFVAIGSAVASASPRGTEQYDDAAFNLATQIMDQPDHRAAFLACGETTIDAECAAGVFGQYGRKLWRRSLTAEESATVVELAMSSATALTSAEAGFEFGLAYLLQSPKFLYRVEAGEPDPGAPETLRYSNAEMASRLSFFFWNAPPDDELLAAAERGELTTDAGLIAQIDRLLASEKARSGVRNFFDEWFRLSALEELKKDPLLFVHFSPDLGRSAREETLLLLDYLVFEKNADYREVLTTRTTFVNRKLASIYEIPAPAREGFARTELPDDMGRAGLLGHASILSMAAHPVSTSSTLRGRFIRETLLCATIEPPPVNVNTALPEPAPGLQTLRERMAAHLSEETCRGCHLSMEPLGLGLEQFDAIGRYRTNENGAVIDPSGDVDGTPFADAIELGEVLANDPSIGKCLSRNMYRYALGRVTGLADRDQVAALSDFFELAGYRVLPLMKAIALSPGFRRLTPPAAEE